MSVTVSPDTFQDKEWTVIGVDHHHFLHCLGHWPGDQEQEEGRLPEEAHSAQLCPVGELPGYHPGMINGHIKLDPKGQGVEGQEEP